MAFSSSHTSYKQCHLHLRGGNYSHTRTHLPRTQNRRQLGFNILLKGTAGVRNWSHRWPQKTLCKMYAPLGAFTLQKWKIVLRTVRGTVPFSAFFFFLNHRNQESFKVIQHLQQDHDSCYFRAEQA